MSFQNYKNSHWQRIIAGSILGLLLSISFSGCFSFGGNGTTTTTSSQQKVDNTSKLYETNAYSIVLPKDWEVIEKKDFTEDIPAETEVVFRSNVKNETFTPTIAIVKKALLEPVSSLEYGKLVHNRQNLGLVDFKQVSENVIKVKKAGQDEDSLFRIYDGRKSADEKLVHYQELYIVKDNIAYITVGGTNPRESDAQVKIVENIVKSFQVK